MHMHNGYKCSISCLCVCTERHGYMNLKCMFFLFAVCLRISITPPKLVDRCWNRTLPLHYHRHADLLLIQHDQRYYVDVTITRASAPYAVTQVSSARIDPIAVQKVAEKNK